MPRTQPETLRDAARAIRAACPECRTLPAGAIPCEACVRQVCRLLAERWAAAQAAQRETKGRETA